MSDTPTRHGQDKLTGKTIISFALRYNRQRCAQCHGRYTATIVKQFGLENSQGHVDWAEPPLCSIKCFEEYRNRRIESMATPDYYEYIRSPEWRARADAAKLRVRYRCQICNRSSSEMTLDAHHRTYERLGNELPEDITVLCRECHELYETHRRIPKPPSRYKASKHSSTSSGSTPSTVQRRATRLPRANIPTSSIPADFQLKEVPIAPNGTWGNKCRHAWAKLAISIVIVLFVLFVAFAVGLW